MSDSVPSELLSGLSEGRMIPFVGPGVLRLSATHLPDSREALCERLVARTSVPPKLRRNLTGAAQFIENFKHRKTLAQGMTEAFAAGGEPSRLHGLLAAAAPPMWVHTWYDDLPRRALSGRSDWGTVQGVSQAEHQGEWTRWYDTSGAVAVPEACAQWSTLLYEPLGSSHPAANWLVSDSDFVEVLTEIDIQTPIPDRVKELRAGRSFLFLGCRFDNQLDRIWAHQVIKRSSDLHWAVLPEAPTRNERKFLEEHGIVRLEISLEEFEESLAGGARKAA